MGETTGTEKAPKKSFFKGLKAEFNKIVWPDHPNYKITHKIICKGGPKTACRIICKHNCKIALEIIS